MLNLSEQQQSAWLNTVIVNLKTDYVIWDKRIYREKV